MNALTKIKQEFGIGSTSEDVFGIFSPPENQCPSIDSIIQYHNYGMNELEESFGIDDIDGVFKNVREAQKYLGGLVDEIESVREAIENIRNWGQEWKDLAKELIESEGIDINKYIVKNK